MMIVVVNGDGDDDGTEQSISLGSLVVSAIWNAWADIDSHFRFQLLASSFASSSLDSLSGWCTLYTVYPRDTRSMYLAHAQVDTYDGIWSVWFSFCTQFYWLRFLRFSTFFLSFLRLMFIECSWIDWLLHTYSSSFFFWYFQCAGTSTKTNKLKKKTNKKQTKMTNNINYVNITYFFFLIAANDLFCESIRVNHFISRLEVLTA